jgi:ATP-binding cassette subfamily F protein uup
MLAQRGVDLASRPAGKAVKADKPASTPAPAAAPQPKRKLSFNEAHALKTLPAQIETLRAKIAALQKQLDDPGLFARDRAKFDTVSGQLASAHSELSAAEEKWLQLEILREEIEGR